MVPLLALFKLIWQLIEGNWQRGEQTHQRNTMRDIEVEGMEKMEGKKTEWARTGKKRQRGTRKSTGREERAG